jgi:hypothetical protein
MIRRIQRFSPCLVMESAQNGDYVRTEELAAVYWLLEKAHTELARLGTPDRTLMEEMETLLPKEKLL